MTHTTPFHCTGAATNLATRSFGGVKIIPESVGRNHCKNGNCRCAIVLTSRPVCFQSKGGEVSANEAVMEKAKTRLEEGRVVWEEQQVGWTFECDICSSRYTNDA